MADTLYEDDEYVPDVEALAARPAAQANALRRRMPLVSTPSSGLEPPPTQPVPSPAQRVGEYRGRALDLLNQAGAAVPQDSDVAALRDYARQRAESQKSDFLMGVALSAKGGESFAPAGQAMLRQALAASEPEKFGGGMIAGGQFIADPELGVQRKVQRLESQARLNESIAAHAESAAQREAAAQAAADARREAAQARADSQRKRLQRVGTTPEGQLVTFDPSEGTQYVGGQAYTGPVMSQQSLDKQVATTQEAMAAAGRSQSLLAKVQANPRAFGGIAALSPYTGQYAGQRILASNLTPDERQVRGQVLREAAQVINDLYGAALTANEERRASGFVPNPADPPEVVMDKLQLALNWANSKANTYGPRIRASAEARGGGAPGAPPTRPAGGTTSWKDLP